jgi:hypothetical protein
MLVHALQQRNVPATREIPSVRELPFNPLQLA